MREHFHPSSVSLRRPQLHALELCAPLRAFLSELFQAPFSLPLGFLLGCGVGVLDDGRVVLFQPAFADAFAFVPEPR